MISDRSLDLQPIVMIAAGAQCTLLVALEPHSRARLAWHESGGLSLCENIPKFEPLLPAH